MVEKNLISELKRPKSVEYRVDKNDSHHGIFIAKPYERGFATTMGNSLRRTLLSGIPGYAVIAVKFDKVNNEFQNVDGVLQDTAEILVNLKKVAIRLKDSNIKSRILHFEVKGKMVFTAGELAKDETIQIGNPDFVIFTANKDANFSFDLQIEWGRGYVPAETFQDDIEVEGTIPLDADFSPVENVSYKIERTRVGSRSDFEMLTLDIRTNGVIKPEEALQEAAQIIKESCMTFNNLEIEVPLTSAIEEGRDGDTDEKDKVFHSSVYSLELTARTHFFLKLNDIREVGQLVTRSEDDLTGKEGCSDKIMEDIREKLAAKELSLGMKNINYTQKTMM